MDVGCGSGILSLLSRRAGAKHVYAIESEAVIEMAKLVVKKNGYQERIPDPHPTSTTTSPALTTLEIA